MEQVAPDYKVDVAIVGGGITGLYLAWRLKKKHVMLFESSGRLGGRVETKHMGNGKFKAEFGPMRFEKVGQKKLMNLLRSLKIETSPFPAYTSALTQWPNYNLDGEEARWSNPLDLLLMGILKVLGKYKDGMSREDMGNKVAAYKEEGYPALRKDARMGGGSIGPFLHQSGLWNVLSEVLSHRAVLKIRDMGNFYHVVHENPNAIEWIIFWLRAFQPGDSLVGIKRGSSTLTSTLEQRVREAEKDIHEKHRLVAFGVISNRVFLEFEQGGKKVLVEAKHAVLALPKGPLEHLSAFLPAAVLQDLDAVRGIPLLKAFFLVTKPWWDEGTRPQTNAGHMPVREVHYYQEHSLQLKEIHRRDLQQGNFTPKIRDAFREARIELPVRVILKTRQNPSGWLVVDSDDNKLFYIAAEDLSVFNRRGKGMVMVYTDRPATEYWNQYVVDRANHSEAEMGKSEELRQRFFKYLARQIREELTQFGDGCPDGLAKFRGMNEEKVAAELVNLVEEWGIRDWEHEPYRGAFHIWRHNAKSWEVIDRLKAFGPGQCLHIAGEAFSNHQGFIEGCLDSAEEALGTLPKDWQENSP